MVPYPGRGEGSDGATVGKTIFTCVYLNLFSRFTDPENFKGLYMVWAKFGPHSKNVNIFYGE
jgi:hypothetical protein